MGELYLINGSLLPKEQPPTDASFADKLLNAGFLLHAAKHLQTVGDQYNDAQQHHTAVAIYDAVIALTKASNAVLEVA